MPAVLGGGGQVGDEAYAVGHPLGYAGSLSSGVISGLDRSVKARERQEAAGADPVRHGRQPRQLRRAAAQPRGTGDRHRHRARKPVARRLLHRHRLRGTDRHRRRCRQRPTQMTRGAMNEQPTLDASLEQVLYQVKRVIVGQDALLERMVVALLARGHLLVEGVPGLAKTMAVKTLAAGDRRRVPAHPVHARPRPGRHRRDARLQPEARRVPGLARARVREPRPRRRDQPGAREGAERAARGDAGAPGHDRPRDAPAARSVPRDGDAEPDRVGGHVSRCRRRRSTGSCSRC